MYCPVCRDEFRPGFARCERCAADLVPELPREDGRASPPPIETPVRVAEYCGFFRLDDAREARDRLRTERIACDILIREAPAADSAAPVEEEFWLRVDRDRYREAHAILGDPTGAVTAEDDGAFACSECGHTVASEESFCPNCGARFDEA